MEKHLVQEYEWPEDVAPFLAHVRFRAEESPSGPDFVFNVGGSGETAEDAAREALRRLRRVSAGYGRTTLLSLHIGRNRIKMKAAPLLLDDLLAEEGPRHGRR